MAEGQPLSAKTTEGEAIAEAHLQHEPKDSHRYPNQPQTTQVPTASHVPSSRIYASNRCLPKGKVDRHRYSVADSESVVGLLRRGGLVCR